MDFPTLRRIRALHATIVLLTGCLLALAACLPEAAEAVGDAAPKDYARENGIPFVISTLMFKSGSCGMHMVLEVEPRSDDLESVTLRAVPWGIEWGAADAQLEPVGAPHEFRADSASDWSDGGCERLRRLPGAARRSFECFALNFTYALANGESRTLRERDMLGVMHIYPGVMYRQSCPHVLTAEGASKRKTLQFTIDMAFRPDRRTGERYVGLRIANATGAALPGLRGVIEFWHSNAYYARRVARSPWECSSPLRSGEMRTFCQVANVALDGALPTHARITDLEADAPGSLDGLAIETVFFRFE